MEEIMEKYQVYRADIIESERGWGQRDDGQILGLTLEKVMEKHWKPRAGEGEDFLYSINGEPYLFEVTKEIYEKVKASDEALYGDFYKRYKLKG